MRRTIRVTALALLLMAMSAAPVFAASRDLPPAVPFYLVGHLLAPVGNVVGWVLVEPMVVLFESVPVLFELD